MSNPAEPSRTRDRTEAWLRAGAWAVGAVLALVQAYAYRNWVNRDTSSYLDISDAVSTHDWSRFGNASWSPLYPALVGVVLRVVRPGPAREFAVVHLVNFLCFLIAFACFEFMLREVVAAAARVDRDDARPLPPWAVRALAYAAFLAGSLGLLTLMKPTPDMLMSGLLYLGAGLVMRVKNRGDAVPTYAALGIVLGLGYWCKTIMFPLGVILLVMSVFVAPTPRRGPRGAAVAGAIFLLVSAPLVAGISKNLGHFSFGEAGRGTHLLWVDSVNVFTGDLGQATGKPVHTPVLIEPRMQAYTYRRPLAVTSHYWYDPSYWAEGVQAGHNVRRQLAVIAKNVAIYVRVLFRLGATFAVLVVFAVLAGGRGTFDALRRQWPVWMIAVPALGAYATVLVEERYIGGLVTLFLAGLLCGVAVPRRLAPRAVQLLVAVAVVNLAVFTAAQMWRDLTDGSVRQISNVGDAQAAVALHQLGVAPGDRVAQVQRKVGDGWARLARVSVIGEVRRIQVDSFWVVPPDARRAVLDAFAAAGAKAVVAYPLPRGAPLPDGWHRLGATNYAAYLLPTTPASNAASAAAPSGGVPAGSAIAR